MKVVFCLFNFLLRTFYNKMSYICLDSESVYFSIVHLSYVKPNNSIFDSNNITYYYNSGAVLKLLYCTFRRQKYKKASVLILNKELINACTKYLTRSSRKANVSTVEHMLRHKHTRNFPLLTI